MNSLLEKYLTETQKTLDEAKEQERKELLISLGLFDTIKEIVPEDLPLSMYSKEGFTSLEMFDGKYKYCRITRVPIEINENEYQQICLMEQMKKEILNNTEPTTPPPEPEYKAEAISTSSTSWGSKCLRFLAWILWIGGLIIAILTANVDKYVGSYSTRIVFDWPLFIQTIILYGVSGAITMCAAELLENISIIATAIRGFRIKEIKKK